MAARSTTKPPTVGRKSHHSFQAAALAAGLTPLNGKAAVEGAYRAQIKTSKADTQLTGSVDIDAHFQTAEPQSPRWGYGIGVQMSDGSELVCWVEPHSASSTDEVTRMLAKLDWLKAKLHTKAFEMLNAMKHASGHRFYWLLKPDGACRISAHSKEARRVAQQGLRMPAKKLSLP